MPRDLREACIVEALAIVEQSGVEHLSMREVARRLGVSHQAPYKHFASRDHILAEIVSRAYRNFIRHLSASPQTDDPAADMARMGQRYIRYAIDHPLQYRLMFESPLPEPSEHPEMMQQANRAFALLRDCLQRLPRGNTDQADQAVDAAALFVWSTVHGLSGVLRSAVVHTLQLPDAVLADAVNSTLAHIGRAIGTAPPSHHSNSGGSQ